MTITQEIDQLKMELLYSHLLKVAATVRFVRPLADYVWLVPSAENTVSLHRAVVQPDWEEAKHIAVPLSELVTLLRGLGVIPDNPAEDGGESARGVKELWDSMNNKRKDENE